MTDPLGTAARLTMGAIVRQPRLACRRGLPLDSAAGRAARFHARRDDDRAADLRHPRAAGASLLAFGVRAQAVATRKLDDIAALYRFDGVLAGDLAQAVARPVRDAGGGVRPAFEGANGASLLRLVRRGWSNVDAAPRASVQRVDYALNDDGAIVRIAYPMLDGAMPLPPAVMLRGVAAVAVRYRLRGA